MPQSGRSPSAKETRQSQYKAQQGCKAERLEMQHSEAGAGTWIGTGTGTKAYQSLLVPGLHSLGDLAHVDGAARPRGLKMIKTPPPLPATS